jgi:hypothetical protein
MIAAIGVIRLAFGPTTTKSASDRLARLQRGRVRGEGKWKWIQLLQRPQAMWIYFPMRF